MKFDVVVIGGGWAGRTVADRLAGAGLRVCVVSEGLSLVSSLDPADPVPSCRNADGTYVPGQSFVLTVDGFIVSDNVEVQSCRVIDDGFACSDHNPVKMTFTLKKE